MDREHLVILSGPSEPLMLIWVNPYDKSPVLALSFRPSEPLMLICDNPTEQQALVEMYNALIYVLIRYDIKPFTEPAVVKAFETISKLWDGTADGWVHHYNRTFDIVQEAANG